MRHWIIDQDGVLLPSWQEAFPHAVLLSRDQAALIPEREPGILWYRLRAGETTSKLSLPRQSAVRRFVVLLADEPDEFAVTEALEAGASGCCNTHAAPDVLRQVALVVENGGLWVGQSLLLRLVGSTSRLLGRPEQGRNDQDDWSSHLSEREIQVARLVANGASNKEIAGQLSITERTVKAHLTAIFEKLALRDRLQLSLRINGLAI